MCVCRVCACFVLPGVRCRLRDGGVQGSSSESDEEGQEEEDGGGEASSDERGEGNNDREEGDTSNLDTSEDDDTRWMSDAESVGSDEVAKLHSEAADFAESDDNADMVRRWSLFSWFVGVSFVVPCHGFRLFVVPVCNVRDGLLPVYLRKRFATKSDVKKFTMKLHWQMPTVRC